MMMTATDKILGSMPLTARQAALAKRTYALLGLSALAAVGGGYVGTTTPALVRFLSSLLGFLVAFVVINLTPRLALRAAKAPPLLGLGALLLDGFVSGLVLAPILFIAAHKSPAILTASALVTGAVFLGVTSYLLVARRRFSAPVSLMTGLFFGATAAISMNLFLHLPILSTMIALAVGVLGVLMLVFATSEVLSSPDFDSPVQGSLMLFAALFNIFVAVLNLLLRLSGAPSKG